MAELKTRETDESVSAFLNAVPDDKQRADSWEILSLMEEATGAEPKMWGTSIVGFGNYSYKYETGRTGEWFLAGFSPRKKTLTLYIMAGFDDYEDLLKRLGKFSTGKSCLYINKLEDVDQDALKELVRKSARHVAETNEAP